MSLVDDLEHTGRYVEFSDKNYETFSVEYSRIILAAGSEIDVVAKMLYPATVSAPARPTIEDHRRIISAEFPLLWSTEVEVQRHGLQFVPWEDWSKGKHPDWWNFYNKVKHHRGQFFEQANLRNALQTVAGLAVMVWYAHIKELTETWVEPKPHFLTLANKYFFSATAEMHRKYCPPDFLRPDVLKNLPLRRK